MRSAMPITVKHGRGTVFDGKTNKYSVFSNIEL